MRATELESQICFLCAISVATDDEVAGQGAEGFRKVSLVAKAV